MKLRTYIIQLIYDEVKWHLKYVIPTWVCIIYDTCRHGMMLYVCVLCLEYFTVTCFLTTITLSWKEFHPLLLKRIVIFGSLSFSFIHISSKSKLKFNILHGTNKTYSEEDVIFINCISKNINISSQNVS